MGGGKRKPDEQERVQGHMCVSVCALQYAVWQATSEPTTAKAKKKKGGKPSVLVCAMCGKSSQDVNGQIKKKS